MVEKYLETVVSSLLPSFLVVNDGRSPDFVVSSQFVWKSGVQTGPDSDGYRCQTNVRWKKRRACKAMGNAGDCDELEHKGSLQWGADAAGGTNSSGLLDHLSFFRKTRNTKF